MIGNLYKPFDNSFCINIVTNKKARIVQKDEFDYDYNGPDIEENNADFKIVSDSYQEDIECFGGIRTYTFINVISSKTNNIYRVLYNKRYVI